MNSKKIILIVFLILLASLAYWCFVPTYKFRYYSSKDKSQILTRVTYPNTLLNSNVTYFTPGHYNQQQIPASYVKPYNSIDAGWAMYVTFHSKGILLRGGNSAEVKNLSESFLYRSGSYQNYDDGLADGSLIATFKHTESLAIYSYDN